MKIHIHPNYSKYDSFIRNIPSQNYKVEKVYCNKRNTVERVRIGDSLFVVKKYKRPTLANCVIYTWFRKSKARRSFEYAEKLLEEGIATAEPVAYIEIKKFGFFHTGYFISKFIPHPTLNEIDGLKEEDLDLAKKDFIQFTADLHKRNIIPLDYNKGNIFFYKEGEHFNFALVDINRIRFGKTNLKTQVKAFEQLGLCLNTDICALLAYAKILNYDLEDVLWKTLINRKEGRTKKALKKALKKTIKIITLKKTA
ncbi:MAG: hypothetical protein WCQ86_01880 [Bacteroidaceae bacterium]